jgi:hypothetical protein
MSMIIREDGCPSDASNVIDQSRDTIACRWSNAKMLNGGCSGVFFKDNGRVALLVVVFSIAGLTVTGCSSTGGAMKAGLIFPVTSGQQGSVSGGDGAYQSARGPGFNDLTGS